MGRSREKVTFPIILKTDKGDSIKRIVTVDLLDSEEVTFLCGEETLKKWDTMLDFGEQKLTFKNQHGQKVELER